MRIKSYPDPQSCERQLIEVLESRTLVSSNQKRLRACFIKRSTLLALSLSTRCSYNSASPWLRLLRRAKEVQIFAPHASHNPYLIDHVKCACVVPSTLEVDMAGKAMTGTEEADAILNAAEGTATAGSIWMSPLCLARCCHTLPV